MDNPIQSLWIGKELSMMESLCINSYLGNGHEFHLYLYDPVDHVPEGTTIKDANEIIPRDEVFKDIFGSYANFANKFRFTLLYEKGSWWVDMDTVCLKPFDFTENYIFSSESSDPYHRVLVNNTYMKSPPRAKFLKDCLSFIDTRGYTNIHWGELGINLMSRMIFRNELDKYIRPPEYFCPISFYNLGFITGNSAYHISANTYAIHLWHDVWRRQNLDKNRPYPINSVYEMLKMKYKVHEQFGKSEYTCI